MYLEFSTSFHSGSGFCLSPWAIQGLSTSLSQSLSRGGGVWVWWFGFEFGGCCFRSAVAGGLGWLWIVVGGRLRWSCVIVCSGFF